MSRPDGDPRHPRRVSDFDALVDYAGLLVAVPLIVFITWLILSPTHFSLEITGHHVDEILTAHLLDASILLIVACIILLLRHPPIHLLWKGLTLGIFVSLLVVSCWQTMELLNYWSQPK